MDNDVKIIGNLKKFEKLDLSDLTTITDNSLKYIYGLKELSLRNCVKISNFGLKRLIKFSPKLQLLDVTGRRKIRKTYIRKIVPVIGDSIIVR